MAKCYNTTDLSPDKAFERHLFHRDQFAHYLRWTHILKEAKIGESIVDFGCGQANLLEVLYRNKFKQKEYVGIDIRKKTIEQAAEKFAYIPWAHFFVADLVKNYMDFSQFNADKVCAFEVLEHVGKQMLISSLKTLRLVAITMLLITSLLRIMTQLLVQQVIIPMIQVMVVESMCRSSTIGNSKAFSHSTS